MLTIDIRSRMNSTPLSRAAYYWRLASKLRGIADTAPLEALAERLLDIAAQCERLAHRNEEASALEEGPSVGGTQAAKKHCGVLLKQRRR